MTARKIKVSAIETPSPKNTTLVQRQLKESVEVGQRLRGDPQDSFVRVNELTQGGLWKLVNDSLVPGTVGSGNASITVANSITGAGTGASPLQLVGDAASPGNTQLYGTNASGVKGWYAQPTGTVGPQGPAGPAGANGGLPLLGSAVASGSSATLTVSSIPQNYTDLQVVVVGRSTVGSGGANILMQMNGDSGTNYDWQLVQAFNGAPAGGSGNGVTSAQVGAVPGAAATASRPGVARIYLPMYAGTTFDKTGTSECGDTNSVAASNGIQLYMLNWRPATPAAVTSLTLSVNTGNWVAGSQVFVYGVGPNSGTPGFTNSGALVQLGEQILGSAAATITFSAIPQSYRNLKLKMSFQASVNTTPQFLLQFNGDTTAGHYTGSIVFANSATGAQGTGVGSSTGIALSSNVPANSTANQPGVVEIDIYDYARTQYNKSVTGNWYRLDTFNTTYYAGALGGTWLSTAAVTSLTLSLSSGSFAAGTVVTLYGEGGASGTSPNITPDTHPTSPTAWDDEFEGTSLNLSLWTWLNQSTALATLQEGSLLMSTSGAGTGEAFIIQPVPGSTPYEFTARMAVTSPTNNASLGIAFYNSGNSKVTYCGFTNVSNVLYVLVQKLTNPTTFSSNSVLASSGLPYPFTTSYYYYWKVKNDGTNLSYAFSMTGQPGSFTNAFSEPIATFMGAVTHVGLTISTVANMSGYFDWFRRTL